MAPRVVVLVALCICILPAFVTSVPFPFQFRVQGRVYCDTCRAGFETNVTTYIAGATVRVQCKDRKTLQRVFSVEGETDATGTYDILVENDRQDEICECVLVRSPLPGCNTIDAGRSTSSIVLTRSDNGVLNQLHYANALGCLKDEQLPGCRQLLEYYLSDI